MTPSSPVPVAPIVSTSRGAYDGSHFVITPANHMPSRLPFLAGTIVRKLTTPRNGKSRIGFTLLEIEPGGGTERPIGDGFEHFLYALSPGVEIVTDGRTQALPPTGFVFVPPTDSFDYTNTGDETARLLWIKKRYEPYPGVAAPKARSGVFDDIDLLPGSVPGVWRKEALDPLDPSFDFTISILALDPGAIFPRVEVHDEEHGLWMTQGQGIYYLNGAHYDVQTNDYIYMAPYCPQYFYPTGPERAAYLLYKDTCRDGFSYPAESAAGSRVEGGTT